MSIIKLNQDWEQNKKRCDKIQQDYITMNKVLKDIFLENFNNKVYIRKQGSFDNELVVVDDVMLFPENIENSIVYGWTIKTDLTIRESVDRLNDKNNHDLFPILDSYQKHVADLDDDLTEIDPKDALYEDHVKLIELVRKRYTRIAKLFSTGNKPGRHKKKK